MKRLLGSVLFFAFVLVAQPTALDRDVQAPDSSYRYRLVTNRPGTGYTRYVRDMTSQSWRAASEVNRTLWRHWVTIIRPEKVEGETALLFITGGSNDGKPPERPDPMLLNMALTTSTVVAQVRLVPNQPLVFSDDKQPRREDEIIAYTWDKFLRGGDETWPLRLPMTKAAVRAMDTVTAFGAAPEGGGVRVQKFVVAGASKRGWTTWTTAAVDRRVVAIAPLVIDVLNVEKALVHHWRAYGFWAPAINLRVPSSNLSGCLGFRNPHGQP